MHVIAKNKENILSDTLIRCLFCYKCMHNNGSGLYLISNILNFNEMYGTEVF